MDYIKAATQRTEDVIISGKYYKIDRLPLFKHYKLKNIAYKIDKGIDIVDAIFDYIKLASGLDNVEDIPLEELPKLFDKLTELNKVSDEDTLPWQKTFNAEGNVRINVDYDNRELAIIVDILASTYGWDIETIHNMSPELAACYVQEALLDDWKTKEFQYMMFEGAYDKEGKYKPFPKPSWYIEIVGATMDEAKTMVPSRFMPGGVVFDVTKQNKDS